MRRFVAWSLVATLSLAGCAEAGSSTPSPKASPSPDTASPAASAAVVDERSLAERQVTEPVRLVTLGDAYTRGTDTPAPRRDSWPSQLVEAMERSDVDLVLRNLAEPSHTSGDVLLIQLDKVESLEPDVVTLQVGVNDIIAREEDWYGENVATILDELLAILPAERIFAITTPDHTLTDWGDSYSSRTIGREAVAELNTMLTERADERGIEVIDISSVNALVSADPSLVIENGPYPTAKQYAGWVEVIGPEIHRALAASGA